MPDTVHCDTHGESAAAYVCAHLTDETSGLGFNRNEPSDDNPHPDAWCDACEMIRAEYNGWDDAPDELCKIKLLCAECYERSRIRNTKPTVTFDDLANLRWKCGHCEEWHAGPLLDISFKAPEHWRKEYDKGQRWMVLPSGALDETASRFLDRDYCAIDGDYFVRGLVHLPILGAAETFRWGAWGSLSRENFEKLLRAEKDPARARLSPMFSWLSTRIPEYPDTLNLKMYAHIQEPGACPHFRLERCDHLLSVEYHCGITPERVREIMFRRLPAQEQ